MSPSIAKPIKRMEMLMEAEDKTGFEEANFGKRGFFFRQPDLRPCVCGREPADKMKLFPETENDDRRHT